MNAELSVLLRALWSVTLMSALGGQSRAELTFTRTFEANKLVPDFGELADAHNLVLGGGTVTDVNVGLVLQGPENLPVWAGDYYVSLGHGTGFAVLANRIGATDTDPFGSGANGFSVTFDDAAPAGDIHAAPYHANNLSPPPVTGTWAPDARDVDPALVTADSLRTAFLTSFNGASTDGEWRLLIADESSGALALLREWTLEIAFAPSTGPMVINSADTLAASSSQVPSGDVVNRGRINAPSAAGAALNLAGAVTGAGSFTGNIALLGSYSPGEGPALVNFDGALTFGSDHSLTLEIGGTTPGSGYDSLSVSGLLTLGGSVNIVFVNGFVPAPGDLFQFFGASSIGGSFIQYNLPSGYVALGDLLHGGGVGLALVPEPASSATLAGALTLLLIAARRRRRA